MKTCKECDKTLVGRQRSWCSVICKDRHRYKTDPDRRVHSPAWNERAKLRRQTNPEPYRAAVRRWIEKNPDKARDNTLKWHKANPERTRAIQKKWSDAHPETVLENTRRWRQGNPERRAEQGRRRRATKSGASEIDMDLTLQGVFDRDAGICYLCDEVVDRGHASVEHVVPLSKGGSHTWTNVRLAHISCNSRKGVKSLEEFRTAG